MTDRPQQTYDLDIDTSVAHPARVYDYLLGGKDNFEADQAATERAFQFFPGGVPGARANARDNRAFMCRLVRYLAGEVGIRQYLDIGTGIPTAPNVHQVAQEEVRASRIVYVDFDPIVLAHAQELMTSAPEGASVYVRGDLRQPEPILQQARAILDFTQPVAIMLIGVLHFVTAAHDPYRVVRRLVDAVPSGSYLAISHLANDIRGEEMTRMAERLSQSMSEAMVLRGRDAVVRFFEDLDLIDPGVVQVSKWRPDPTDPQHEFESALHGALARKP